MNRIKVFGAGSIGNHIAHAARRLGWDVVVADVSEAALRRMKNEIYPGRYGRWDDSIQLYHNDAAPRGGFDVIFIGTPPDHHLPLALAALDETPRAIVVEKPLCSPSLELADELHQAALSSRSKVYVGYDHVVGAAVRRTEELIATGEVGQIQTIDVEFREHWGGIFAAHPWLNGPGDSYLGYWQRGGGASGEHSHAINLWQHFAHVIRAGRVTEVRAALRYVRDGTVDYDDLCFVTLRTEHGLIGRVVQDVVTRPHRKRARLQGTEGAVVWVCNHSPDGDAVVIQRPGVPETVEPIRKRRPDDFVWELEHIDAHSRDASGHSPSPLALERGLDTMLAVAAAHQSERDRAAVVVDYSRGYSSAALRSGPLEVTSESSP